MSDNYMSGLINALGPGAQNWKVSSKQTSKGPVVVCSNNHYPVDLVARPSNSCGRATQAVFHSTGGKQVFHHIDR